MDNIGIRRWYRGSLPHGRGTPLELIMVQPTPFCNILCKYCYLPNRSDKSRLAPERLGRLLDKLRAADLLGEDATVLWHGGEPLALPQGYYEEAFAVMAEHAGSTRLAHNIQTNAMLLTETYVAFLRKWQVSVGVSIDGPEDLHDRYRVTRSGRPTHEKVLRGLELLKRGRVPFSVICVLTADSLEHPDRIYEFFRDAGVTELGFNVDEAEGDYLKSSLEGDLREKFIRFLKQFYYRVERDGHRLNVRELKQGLSIVAGSMFSQPLSTTENNPLSILNIDANGGISSFSPELIGYKSEAYTDFLFGTIEDIEFELLYSNPAFARLNADIQQGVLNCRRSCTYFSVCGGGAPATKWFENGSFTSTETTFCRFKKKYVADAVSDLVTEAAERRRVEWA